MARSARNVFTAPRRAVDQSAGDVDPDQPGTVWLGRQPDETAAPKDDAPDETPPA